MATDTFELDYKAYMPRMGRIRKKFDPDIAQWRKIKDVVRNDKPIDWQHIIKHFRVGSLLCPQKLRPASPDEHRNLKDVYAFFEHGYILRQGDSTALFSRVDKNQRITKGHSIIVSSTPTTMQDHTDGLGKLESYIEVSLGSVRPVPFAIGYSELQLHGRQKYPAYVWLLHEVPCSGMLSKSRHARSGRDSFRGMKQLSRLYDQKVQCDGEPVKINGVFDKLLIEMLAKDHERIVGSNAAVRLLNPGEIRNIPAKEFKKSNEKLRKRLISLGILATTTTSSSWIVKEAIDWARRSDWVCENWNEIAELMQNIERIGKSYF